MIVSMIDSICTLFRSSILGTMFFPTLQLPVPTSPPLPPSCSRRSQPASWGGCPPWDGRLRI